jgi:hypothetical protein
MSDEGTSERLAAKTPEAAFLHVLQSEFHFAPRVAGEVLQAAQEMLLGQPARNLRPGQVRLVVARADAPFGPGLAATEKVEVTLTLERGADDVAVQQRDGRIGLRRGRLLSIIEEALAQGGVLTHEDIARALQVDVRTVRRDVQALKAAGHLLHTRGQLQGVGRGQTHKVRIIELWLAREGYEKIARWLHHSPQAIKRYVSTFLRIVLLHRQAHPVEEIAFLTRSSRALVEQYLTLYQAALRDAPRREKLEEELARVQSWQTPASREAQKGGWQR